MNSTPNGRIRKPQITRKRIGTIRPSPENDRLYGPVNVDDPEIIALAKSIKTHGIKEPLVITRDRYLLSGHRRHTAARLAGHKTVPVRVASYRRAGNIDRFVTELREYNRQRDKTRAEKLREELVTASPNQAYQSLIAHRRQQSRVNGNSVKIEGYKTRWEISDVKNEMLQEVRRIVYRERRDYWPLSVRAIHYAMLNKPPLRNTSRPESRYQNDRASYQDLSNLLTRARLVGEIHWEAIGDETRPSTIWKVWANPRLFVRDQCNGFLKGYWRDLMQSQPNHVEVLVEKNTVYSMTKNVTMKYCIPTMSGRGFSSIDPYHEIFERYRKSGKEKLIVLVASDFDPEGEEIVQVAGRTLRDDFGVFSTRLKIVKVAITEEQIQRFQLPANVEAKESSSRYQKFVDRHGTAVYELEALRPEQLQQELTNTIDSVIDTKAFNDELNAEKEDAAFLQGVRHTALEGMKNLDV